MANIVTFLRFISHSAGFATHARTHSHAHTHTHASAKFYFYLTATPAADAGENYDQA